MNPRVSSGRVKDSGSGGEGTTKLEAPRRVLLAGIHLIKSGYGRLSLLPYLGGTGAWRCEFHPMGRPDRPVYRYTNASAFKFLADHGGHAVRTTVTPKALAKAIIAGVPEQVRERCSGPAPEEYLRWLQVLLEALNRDTIPVAFDEYTEDRTRWEIYGPTGKQSLTIAPPPGYVFPGDEGPVSAQPFWRPRLALWEELAGVDALKASATALDEGGSEALAEIAQELRYELVSTDAADASTYFLSALRAALVALQPSRPESNA